MADYNINMKQWNGTSFDNVLPLAYNAKQLEGQSLAEVIASATLNRIAFESVKVAGVDSSSISATFQKPPRFIVFSMYGYQNGSFGIAANIEEYEVDGHKISTNANTISEGTTGHTNVQFCQTSGFVTFNGASVTIPASMVSVGYAPNGFPVVIYAFY